MPKGHFHIRRAMVKDAAEIALIYNQAIEERMATFNTERVTEEEIIERIKNNNGRHPVFVAVLNSTNKVIGWASISPYSPRVCYNGIGEVSVYVEKGYRGHGVGSALLQSLIEEARQKGYWKLIGRILIFNEVSRMLAKKAGFREVCVLEKHGKLGGRWIDVVEVERLIPENIL